MKQQGPSYMSAWKRTNAKSKPRKKRAVLMTLEELRETEVEYDETIKRMESKKIDNGGIGLLPATYVELRTLKEKLVKVRALIHDKTVEPIAK